MDSIKEMCDKIEGFIRNGNIEKAIETLALLASGENRTNPYIKEVCLIIYRHRSLSRQKITGTLDPNSIMIENNKIVESILTVVRFLKKELDYKNVENILLSLSNENINNTRIPDDIKNIDIYTYSKSEYEKSLKKDLGIILLTFLVTSFFIDLSLLILFGFLIISYLITHSADSE